MDHNLPRWIFSSCAKHFGTVAATIPTIKYHVQGVDEPEIENFQNDSALFIMDGPVAYYGSNGVEWYRVELCILLTDIIQRTGDSAYAIYEWAGKFQASMLNDMINIKKFGSGADDDPTTLIGCLVPDNRLSNNVWVHNYGQLDKDLRIKQVAVTGRFILEI